MLLGILTVGKLEERLPKERIVALAFFAGGLVLIAVASYVTGWSVLIASFAIGLTFAWKKIPVDTMVQEAIPDGYRGRVFAVYDVAYNLSRVAAAFLAIPLQNAFGEAWAVAIVGVVFILWSPILPRWIGRIPSSRSGSTRAPAPRRTLGRSSGVGSRRPSRSSAARWRNRRRATDALSPEDAGRDHDRGLEGRTRRRLDARARARLTERRHDRANTAERETRW